MPENDAVSFAMDALRLAEKLHVSEISSDLREGPYRQALELARSILDAVHDPGTGRLVVGSATRLGWARQNLKPDGLDDEDFRWNVFSAIERSGEWLLEETGSQEMCFACGNGLCRRAVGQEPKNRDEASLLQERFLESVKLLDEARERLSENENELAILRTDNRKLRDVNALLIKRNRDSDGEPSHVHYSEVICPRCQASLDPFTGSCMCLK